MIAISTQRLTRSAAIHSAMDWVMKSDESVKENSSDAPMIIMIITLSLIVSRKIGIKASSFHIR